MPPIIGDNLWPSNGITPPAAPQKIVASADDGDTPSVDTAAESPLTASSATTTTSNSQTGAHTLIRQLIALVRWRCSLLSSLEINGEIDTLLARYHAEMLKSDAESIMSLMADLPHKK